MRPDSPAFLRRLAPLLLATVLPWPASALANCQIQSLEMPVRIIDHRAVATVGINGEQVPLAVDSGAFFSMLTGASAQQLHLRTHPLPWGFRVEGLTGRIESEMTTVDHLKLLNGDVPDVEFMVGGNQMNAGAMGLLGRNILSIMDTEYDLAHGVIRFVLPNADCDGMNMAYWAGDTPVTELKLLRETRDRLPALRALVELNGHKVIALFDTGATTTVSLHAAHAAGVQDADMTPAGIMHGAGVGSARMWTAPFQSVALGDELVSNNRLRVGDYSADDNDMLLGIDFFLSHRIYVSKKRARMFFTYGGGPVFGLNEVAHADAAASGASAADGAATPQDADALARRGQASLARGDLAGALADLDRACALAPGNADMFWARARVRLAMNAPEAAADLDAALALDPGLHDARLARAALRERTHKRTAALEDLAVLDRTLPPPSDLRSAMARLYGVARQPALAIAQWNLWIPAHPNDIGRAVALNERSWERMELGVDLDKALDDCDDAIDAEDKNALFLDTRGWVQLRRGQWKKSLADFDRALAINPKSAWSLYGRAQAKLALGGPDQGVADAAAARRLRPGIDEDARRDGLPPVPPPLQAPASAPAAAAAASAP